MAPQVQMFKTLFKQSSSIRPSFKRVTHEFGEELQHRLSGVRVYKPKNDVPGAVHLPQMIYPNGKHGSITLDEYNKLLEKMIRKTDDGLTYVDDFTGNTYFKNSGLAIGGGLPRVQKPDGSYQSIKPSLWNQITDLFA